MQPLDAVPSVLIVEDDPFVRDFLAAAFGRDGWSTAVAGTGEEALALAAATAFDLLLVDVVLPHGDGAALVALLSDRQPRARVLLMSGYPAAHLQRRRCDTAVAPLLQKPFSIRIALTRARAMIAAAARLGSGA